jgi:hypothetical protein
MKFNGYRSWNAWNVSLWINNDESLYFYARDLTEEHGRKKAARILTNDLAGTKTPDGARYNYTCIYEALEDIV